MSAIKHGLWFKITVLESSLCVTISNNRIPKSMKSRAEESRGFSPNSSKLPLIMSSFEVKFLVDVKCMANENHGPIYLKMYLHYNGVFTIQHRYTRNDTFMFTNYDFAGIMRVVPPF